MAKRPSHLHLAPPPPVALPADPPTQLQFSTRPDERRGSWDFQFMLFQLVWTIGRCTGVRLTRPKLGELMQLFSLADLYGGYSVEWAGCTFQTKRDPVGTLELRLGASVADQLLVDLAAPWPTSCRSCTAKRVLVGTSILWSVSSSASGLALSLFRAPGITTPPECPSSTARLPGSSGRRI